MCLNYRMNAINAKPVNNSAKKNSKGLFNSIKNAMGMGNSVEQSMQSGGVAPVNYRYPPNMQQPSDAVMEWTTTAGAPTPLSGMRNVAHGGRRRRHSRKYRTHKHKRNHTRKHKTHRRKHTYKRRK